jgi:cell division protein FtsL
MRGRWDVLGAAVAFVGLLASLNLVVWRQSRALETLRTLDRVRRERAVVEAERATLVRRIQYLESRSRVVQDAAARLGMRLPNGEEIVVLSLGAAGGEAR